MPKKMWMLLALLVIVPGLLLTTSCAKKVVQSEEAVEEVEAPEEAVVEEPAEEDTAAMEAARIAEEAAAQEEAARQWEMAAEEELEEQRLAEEAAKRAAEQRAAEAAKQMLETEDIYFEFDSAVLLPVARAVLDRKAKWLFQNWEESVIIEGHCDERGTAAYNIALGDRRAESVKNYLVDIGIDASRMTTISYGEERPVDPGHNEEAWAKNRRVHFVVE